MELGESSGISFFQYVGIDHKGCDGVCSSSTCFYAKPTQESPKQLRCFQIYLHTGLDFGEGAGFKNMQGTHQRVDVLVHSD